MAASFPGNSNTFVPTFEASGKLVVNYSRNVNTFPLNKYTTLTPVKKTLGYYLRITAENAARLLAVDGVDFSWAPGADRPTGVWNNESFEFQPFMTQRYSFNALLDDQSVDLSDWNIMSYWSAMLAQQAMTLRALKVVTAAETSGNYAQTGTATSLGGGLWSAGTAAAPYIMNTLNNAAQLVQIQTLGVIKPADFVLVISPVAARQMAASQEIHSYLQQQVGSIQVVKGEGDFNPNAAWGLPDQLYGFKIVVEDTVRGSQPKGATFAPGYIKSSNSACLLSRPGALTGVEGSPNWGSITLFSYEEMKVETFSEPKHRRTQLSVTDNYGVYVVSPLAGCLITNLFS